MKKRYILKRFSCIFLCLCMTVGMVVNFVACGDDAADNGKGNGGTDAAKGEFIDYASQVKLDLNGANQTVEVKVKQLIDGDTTHFYIDDPSFDGDIIKAR